MDTKTNHYYDDEIDSREVALTILKGRKVILFSTLLVGAIAFGVSLLLTPVYEATALISIDKNALQLPIDPINFLSSEIVRNNVAERLSVPINDLPELPNNEEAVPSISVTAGKEDETLYVITVQSETASSAQEIANAWADAGVASTLDYLTVYSDEEAKKWDALQEAEQNLSHYLDENQLNAWSWTDLALLTGYGAQPSVLLTDNIESGWSSGENNSSENSAPVVQTYNQKLPPILPQQRLEITKLMRLRSQADVEYNFAWNNYMTISYGAAVAPPQVISYSNKPERPVKPNMLMNTVLGIVVGGMLGGLWVMVAAWWRGVNYSNT